MARVHCALRVSQRHHLAEESGDQRLLMAFRVPGKRFQPVNLYNIPLS